jgi:hypothetical protein
VQNRTAWQSATRAAPIRTSPGSLTPPFRSMRVCPPAKVCFLAPNSLFFCSPQPTAHAQANSHAARVLHWLEEKARRQVPGAPLPRWDHRPSHTSHLHDAVPTTSLFGYAFLFVYLEITARPSSAQRAAGRIARRILELRGSCLARTPPPPPPPPPPQPHQHMPCVGTHTTRVWVPHYPLKPTARTPWHWWVAPRKRN